MSSMEFNTYKLSEICDVKSGKRLPVGSNFSDEITDYPYIRARDIKNGKIDSSSLAYIDENLHKKLKKYIINEGDIALTVVANIGDVGYCEKELDGVNLTENAIRLTNFKNNIDSKYLTYFLSQPFSKLYMEGLAAGAAQSKLGIYKVNKIKVLIPNLDFQKRIVSIISNYDQLIENNNKRIKILEDMAESLYKEWFVRFRFPGYETAEFENGIPKGWIVGNLLDIMLLHDSKRKPISSLERSQKEKLYPYYGAAELMDYIDDYLFDGRYLLMGEDGSVITSEGYPVLQFIEGKFWVNNHAHVISGTTNYSINFIYSLLKKLSINDIVTGAAQPKISIGRMKKKKILIPNLEMVKKYSDVVEPIFNDIFKIKNINQLLIRQRDALLPRLMSGKIDVENMNKSNSKCETNVISFDQFKQMFEMQSAARAKEILEDDIKASYEVYINDKNKKS